jgi:hypothetical protein
MDIGTTLLLLLKPIVIAWNFTMWPTTWGFPVGTIVQVVYLYIGYRLYIRFAPTFVQNFVRSRLKPLVQRGVDEARDVIGGMIRTRRDTDASNSTTERIVYRCSWRRLMYACIFGAILILTLEHIVWPFYIRPSLPF